MIYLDNAATTHIKPAPVRKAVLKALEKYSANPGRSGHELSQNTALAVFSARKNISDFFNTQPEKVIFTANCTQSLNMVIKGVLKKGDHAVISSMEHNAVARPIHKLKEEGIIEYDVAPMILGDSGAIVRSFEQLIRQNTRLIVCTHASIVTGEIMPIKEIAALCKQQKILFAVDAAQSAGVLPIDMDWGIDFLCIAPHKGLYAPMGTGLLIVNAPIGQTLIEGGTGSHSNMLTQPEDLPERFESGTVNVPGILGISAGLDFVKNIGINRIYEHELGLMSRLYSALSAMSGTILYTDPPRAGKNAPVLSFNIAGKNSMQVADVISKNGIAVRAGLHCAPLAHSTIGTIDIGTVRVSPSVFNNEHDIYRLLSVLKTQLA